MSSTDKMTPQQVASTFVQKYYSCLTKDVQNIAHFYKPHSTYTLGTGITTNHQENLVGDKAIAARLKDLHLTGSTVKIHLIDSQLCVNGSVFVVIYGTITKLSPRDFSQSVVLHPQEKGYFVLNDVFRFFEAEKVEKKPVEKVEEKIEKVEKVEKKTEEKEPKKKEAPKKDEVKKVEKVEPKKEEVKKEEKKEEVKKEEPTTYASAVGGDGYVAPVVKKEKVEKKKDDKKIKTEKKDGDKKFEKKDKSLKEGKDARKEKKEDFPEKKKFAIWVADVAPNTTNDELKKAFSSCGVILDVTNKAADKGYAFVYFESDKGVAAALGAKDPFKIGEQVIKVQKRKEKTAFKKFPRKDGKEGKPFVKRDGEKFKEKKEFNKEKK